MLNRKLSQQHTTYIKWHYYKLLDKEFNRIDTEREINLSSKTRRHDVNIQSTSRVIPYWAVCQMSIN